MSENHPPVVIINSSLEIVGLFKDYFANGGLPTMAIEREVFYHDDIKEKIIEFIEKTRPQVIIWDIPPPYRENWNLYQEIRNSPVVREIDFIVITFEKEALERRVGYPTEARKFSGDIKELDEIGRIVREKFAVQKEREC
jgi:hypothetical protein